MSDNKFYRIFLFYRSQTHCKVSLSNLYWNVFLVDSEALVVVRDSLLIIVSSPVGVPPESIGTCPMRVNLNRSIKVKDSPVIIRCFVKSNTSGGVSVGVLRVKFKGFGEVCNGSVIIRSPLHPHALFVCFQSQTLRECGLRYF